MNTRSRKLRTRSDYEGDAELYNSWLLPILNGQPPKGHATPACCERVCQFLSDLLQLETIRGTLKPLARDSVQIKADASPDSVRDLFNGFGLHRFRDPKAEALYQTGAGLVARINNQLLHYRWFPEIRFELETPIRHRQTWDERTESYYHENLAVWLFLVELSEGKIDRFRRCGNCTRWFYAITEHQKYCDAKCRVKEHSQGEEFKRKRARYMREKYRPALRKHEASAKHFLGRERGK
jgi:hypothetical protein